MKLLILLGLIAVAAAQGPIVQQTDACVVIEYDLGYTKVEFQACQSPRDCLIGIDICPSNRQLTPIGAGQFVFLGGPSTGFRPYTIQLFAGTGLANSFCLKGSPTLRHCYHQEIEAQMIDEEPDFRELERMLDSIGNN